jgi:hypothetical protein
MPEPPPPLSNRKLATMVVAMLAVPLLFVGGYSLLKHESKSVVSGSIRLGEDALTPNRCESGVLSEDAPRTRAQWHGVDLFAATEPKRRVRVIDDPEKGKVVTLRHGDDEPVVVRRDGCKTYEVKLEETGSMILDHYGLEGALRLDCAEIVADVKFESCYDGS